MTHQTQIASLLKDNNHSNIGISVDQTSSHDPGKRFKYPGIDTVIHGNGAVAHVMGHVCGGVIGYPITPSTEISEIYEAFRAVGGCNVWGKHPFFFEPEGEHSAQSGALGAALTGGKYISNASSSQGILYGLESHYVTVGKKIGGFVLQVAARVVSRQSLNVMAGHDDVYALLPSGYTILFGSNPQEAADLAAIAYKVSALSLIPVANAMDGFTTSHMQSETLLPEPQLLREYLGDPQSRIKAPTVAQEMLFGAKGRVFQLQQFLERHQADIPPDWLQELQDYLVNNADETERDGEATSIQATLLWMPQELHEKWKRQWINAAEKGTRLLIPALIDIHNPGLTGGVQNQPDFQAGVVDHRTHFANEIPGFVKQAMKEYGELTGRFYHLVNSILSEDAETVIVGLGSVTDDVEAVASYLRRQGKKVGVVSIKLLHPFPEAEVVDALKGKRAVTVLERSDATTLTNLVTHALFKALENNEQIRHQGIPAISYLPKISTGIFGLGAHDLQPRHLIAAYENMDSAINIPFFYLGSQFFSDQASPAVASLQRRLKSAYPETEFMALETGENPHLLPAEAFRVRFHSVGGYGTIATGKLLTDILAGVLDLHSKSSPKYGSEKSGAPTNFYITLSPEPIKITNAELEEVEIVVSPDHKIFKHTNPLRGLAPGGTFIMQSHHTPLEVWKELPAQARHDIRDNNIHFYIVDAFGVAKKHAPSADLQIRMMGIAFIGAVCGHVDRVVADASEAAILTKVQEQIVKKFGIKGDKVVEGNMRVIKEGLEATQRIDYKDIAFLEAERDTAVQQDAAVSVSSSMVKNAGCTMGFGCFDKDYFDEVVLNRFVDGSIAEAPVIPGTGMFMPVASAVRKDKGLFRLNVPTYNPHLCTGCMECALACPDAAIPNTVHNIHDLLLTAIKTLDVTEQQRQGMQAHAYSLNSFIRESYRGLPSKDPKAFHEIVAQAVASIDTDSATLKKNLQKMIDVLEHYPVARTRPFYELMEKAVPGSGGLYSVNVDPWKCTGCMECVDVCGPGALIEQRQSSEVSTSLQNAFAFLSELPNTPLRFSDTLGRADGDPKRLILDHDNYYAMTGGHGACRGCGEVTPVRLIIAANRAMHQKRYKQHVRELEELIEGMNTKIAEVEAEPDSGDLLRLPRMLDTVKLLQRRLYYFESGPTGKGPASAMIANATGCSSVYASTFPYNPYTDPWVNSLFQDTAPLAKGIFEGLSADIAEDFKAIRMAKLDLDDRYNPDSHDSLFKYFDWNQFSDQEHSLLPSVIAIGGDGAIYDIGFGALSRLLTTDTPIKVVVLNTGSYSNTGGQASTASFTAQDSDLTRFGAVHSGKQESRKELGLIAAFHPEVLVIQTTAAMQAHFMKNIMLFLNNNSSPALLDVYTTCQSEHGAADNAAMRRAKLAVESRMNPVFVHDPRSGGTLAERFSLQGNPAFEKDWTQTALEYIDEKGDTQLKEITLTPADFAHREGRFKKHFRQAQNDDITVPVDEYIQLSAQQRDGTVPFIWSTDAENKLVKLVVSAAVIQLTEERLAHWRMLQYLSGLHVNRLEERHRQQLKEWQQKYQQAVQEKEHSMDAIARGMSELASLSAAPTTAGESIVKVPVSTITSSAPRTVSAGNEAGAQSKLPLVDITPEDMTQCTNCKTCYQELGELFEKTSIVADGGAMDVARVIPGALDNLELTPELINRAAYIADDCDAEIIRFNRP